MSSLTNMFVREDIEKKRTLVRCDGKVGSAHLRWRFGAAAHNAQDEEAGYESNAGDVEEQGE